MHQTFAGKHLVESSTHDVNQALDKSKQRIARYGPVPINYVVFADPFVKSTFVSMPSAGLCLNAVRGPIYMCR